MSPSPRQGVGQVRRHPLQVVDVRLVHGGGDLVGRGRKKAARFRAAGIECGVRS